MHVRLSVVAAQAARGGADSTQELLTRDTCHRAGEPGVSPGLHIVAGSRVASSRIASLAEPPAPREVMLTITA
jgi:hypothetical protein